MASFNGVDLEVAGGAGGIFEVSTGKIGADFEYLLDGGSALLDAKSNVVIVRGLDSRSYVDALSSAREGANRALDMSLTKRGSPLFLDHHSQPQIVWWSGVDGVTLRIVSVIALSLRLSVTGVVRNAQGEIVHSVTEPQKHWDESLRYYRTSEATGDLLDSFRNLYLGIEALLSLVSPPAIKENGRLEGEGEWLRRVLREVHGKVDLTLFAPASPKAPYNCIVDELYGALRTAIFHAKRGRNTWIPQEWNSRDRIIEGRERYARMFRALATEYLDVTFPSSGLSKDGFAAMNKPIVTDSVVYVSDDPTKHQDEPRGNYGIAPAGGRILKMATYPATELPDDETAGVFGVESGEVVAESIGGIRRFGSLLNDEVGMVENLAGSLDTSGVDRVEVVFLVKSRGYGAPRRDFDS
jgi:hypothetical protein